MNTPFIELGVQGVPGVPLLGTLTITGDIQNTMVPPHSVLFRNDLIPSCLEEHLGNNRNTSGTSCGCSSQTGMNTCSSLCWNTWNTENTSGTGVRGRLR